MAKKEFRTESICRTNEDKRRMRIANALKLVKGTESIGKLMEDDIVKRLYAKLLKGGVIRLSQAETLPLFEIWCAGFGTAMHLIGEGALSSVMLEVDLDPEGGDNES